MSRISFYCYVYLKILINGVWQVVNIVTTLQTMLVTRSSNLSYLRVLANRRGAYLTWQFTSCSSTVVFAGEQFLSCSPCNLPRESKCMTKDDLVFNTSIQSSTKKVYLFSHLTTGVYILYNLSFCTPIWALAEHIRQVCSLPQGLCQMVSLHGLLCQAHSSTTIESHCSIDKLVGTCRYEFGRFQRIVAPRLRYEWARRRLHRRESTLCMQGGWCCHIESAHLRVHVWGGSD